MSGCATCSTGQGVVSGCKNSGGCASGGCNKMNVFDWLSHMEESIADKFNVVEVRFKNGRKEFFRNERPLELTTGDPVVVDVPNGHHIGYVSLQGELVRLQMKKKKVDDDEEVRTIYRIATGKDMERFDEVQNREMPTLFRTRQIIDNLGLEMKLTDVEFQADNTKATFYYSADERVDFRELIKVLASEFKIRVEMRQISLRQEAGRLGGIGSCGRELCCSTWLSDFKSVSTSAARYQNLSLNPSKLSGQCGRLKCCLNYELETYVEALEGIPELKGPLVTQKGEAKLQKTDIFRRIMWFGYDNENTWHPISTDRVVEIIELNANNEVPATLLENELFESAIDSLNSDLEQLDRKLKKRSQKQRNKRKRRTGPAGSGSSTPNAGNSGPKPKAQQGQGQNQQSGGSSQRNRRRGPKNKPGGGENQPAKATNQKASAPQPQKPKGEQADNKKKKPNKPRRRRGPRNNNNNQGPKNDA